MSALRGQVAPETKTIDQTKTETLQDIKIPWDLSLCVAGSGAQIWDLLTTAAKADRRLATKDWSFMKYQLRVSLL